MPAPLLIGLDGAPHTDAALEWAVRLARALDCELVGLYVADPYLKKFYNELYSQGRREYLDYIDETLRDEARTVGDDFLRRCRAAGVSGRYRVRAGDPLEEIPAEVVGAEYDLLIFGGRALGAWGRFRSRRLPERLRRRLALATMIVPQSDPAR